MCNYILSRLWSLLYLSWLSNWVLLADLIIVQKWFQPLSIDLGATYAISWESVYCDSFLRICRKLINILQHSFTITSQFCSILRTKENPAWDFCCFHWFSCHQNFVQDILWKRSSYSIWNRGAIFSIWLLRMQTSFLINTTFDKVE